MYLKRLEIQGFKTFAARVVLEFRPGITAIIGPNGSGKSNILDAIRWVLGEQSYSTLRSKRADDLIFSGGNRRAPAGFAEVSLTIDNTDRLLPLPYGEVTISRRATRAGEFEYQLNRNRVRLRDVQEAIGPLGGSYTIINQGLVDAALNLRPEDRRRLFDDAAEIGVYEQRKHEAERRLRETAANIQRCDDVLADLEPRLRSLKRQASLARSFRDLQEELRSYLIRGYIAQRRAAQTALAVATQAEQAAEASVQQARIGQQAAQAELQARRDQMRALREQLQALHAASSALHEQAEQAQRDLAVGQERAAAAERRAEDLARRAAELELRQHEIEREQADTQARLDVASTRATSQRSEVLAQEAALAGREQERRAARQAFEQAQRIEMQATAAIAEALRRSTQLQERSARLVAERTALAPTLAAAERTRSERQAALAAAQLAEQQAEQNLVAAGDALDQARMAADQSRSVLADADETLAHARRSLADAEARLESLSRLQRSYTGAFAGVRAAMQWAEANQRSGFVLVSSILRTPDELETAVEVALGARLQQIVVDSWADAEAAIDALKRSGAGRATFLPLDTLKANRGDGSPRPRPGVRGVAAELVEADQRYQVVLWHLLGRTLVVDDLATARRELRTIGTGWTIVTLAGEQLSSAGALTGGAQIRESGALRRERELRELPTIVEAQRAGIAATQQERAAAEQQLAASEQARRQAEQNRRQAQQDRDSQRDLQARAQRATQQAEADLVLLQRRDAQIATELAEYEQQTRMLVEEQASLAAREQQAAAHLASLRAEEQARAHTDQAEQQQLTTLRTVLAAAEGEVRAERALAQSHAQQLVRLASEHAEISQRLGTLQQERAAAAERTQQLEASHSALLAEIDQLRSQIQPAEAEATAGEQALEGLEQRTTSTTNALLAAEARHGNHALEVQRTRDRLDALWERAAGDDIDLEALPEPDPQIVEPEQPEALTEQIAALKTRIQRLGVVNPLALEEYTETNQRVEFLTRQLTDLRSAERSLNELIEELDEAMHARFERTFTAVAAEFERSFEQLFGGGHARLVLTRPDGSEAGPERNGELLGVDIIARPPGKRQQTLALLSGGERALTAAALLFAILKVNPSPFCVLDEVDAALDEANVGRFRDALAMLAEETQFLVITHNRGTIEVADTIYGVSMGDDSASRMLSLRLEEIEG